MRELTGKMTAVGNVISGSVSQRIVIRLRSDAKVDVGDVLTCQDADTGDRFFLKAVNIGISSLVPSQFIEDMAGQKLEHDFEFRTFDHQDRFYKMCEAKILKILRQDRFIPPRVIPKHFSDVYTVNAEEFSFIQDKGEIRIGSLRLGADALKDVTLSLPARELISHHMLVVAATGKGKSNFAKVFLSGILKLDNYSAIVLDPHNEYYGGRGVRGLRDHVLRSKVLYFSPKYLDTPGSEALRIFTEDLEPDDFFGVIDLSVPQQEAMDLLARSFGKVWIKALLDTEADQLVDQFQGKIYKATLTTLKRKLHHALELRGQDGLVFSTKQKDSISVYDKIKQAITERKLMVVDTSAVGEETEKIIASSILNRVFKEHREAKQEAPQDFASRPEVLVMFEEAPRVLGIDVLSKGSNIFERIAREGRKFKVGLCAITQMPSLLPREILSQMNTKVILGLPSPMDRDAVINSSAQNISDEGAEIQMLDKGEAIITSPFIDFPLPVKVFLFENVLKEDSVLVQKKTPVFVGVD
jgi:hypothetical protein